MMRFIYIFWYLLSIIVFMVLNYSFSIVFYNSTKLFFPILTTIISLFFVFLGLYKVDKIGNLLYTKFNSEENNSGIRYVILFVLLLFGIIASYFIFEKRVEEALVKDGIVVKAKIRDGEHEYTEGFKRTPDKYYLDLFFKTEAGLECEFKTEVTADIYENAYKDLKVDVVYLEYDPSVFKVLLSDENIKRYRRIENRNLNFKDLEKFISLPDNKKFKFLKEISGGWDTKVEDYGRIYFNSLKNEAITVLYDDERTFLYQYISNGEKDTFLNPSQISTKTIVPYSKLKSIGYFEIVGIASGELYTVKNYTIEKTINGTRNYLIQKK